MTNLLYIHGYGSSGNATKAQKMRAMFPEAQVVAPTFNYDNHAPQEVFQQLKQTIEEVEPKLILGSSTGGYYALCCTNFYQGVVWCVNPLREVLYAVKNIFHKDEADPLLFDTKIRQYEVFDRTVFQQLKPKDGRLHFALSTDDETLGDHRPLLAQFSNYASVIWKDHCGHRFFRFEELRDAIAESIQHLSEKQ